MHLIVADDGGVSSDEELSCGEVEGQRSEDNELKGRLLRKFGSHLSSLKLEFSKKKKKGKLPKEARQMLLAWWNDHYRWPYPTVCTSYLYPSFTFTLMPFCSCSSVSLKMHALNIVYFLRI